MGAQLGSSVALGSGCGEALPGVPRQAPLCSFDEPVQVFFGDELVMLGLINKEALGAAPPEALTHSPSQMPLS